MTDPTLTPSGTSHDTFKSIAESAAQVAVSVSWALPPPWNVGVTAGLTLLQILMKATDNPKGPSPIVQLQTSLVDYLEARTTDKIADNIRLFNENLLLKTEDFTFDPEQLTTVGSDVEKQFDNWWNGPTGIFTIEKYTNRAISDLERITAAVLTTAQPPDNTPPLDKGADSLAVACTGVTAWTTGMKVRMQLAASTITAQMSNNDATGLADSSASWRTFLDQIHDRLFDLAGENPGDPAVKGWASRIEEWIDTARTARLAQLHVERASYLESVFDPGSGDCEPTEFGGWRFHDDSDKDDEKSSDAVDRSSYKHFFPDTEQDSGPTIEHKDDADSLMAAAVQAINDKTKGATDALSALRAKVSEIVNLAPPLPPKDHRPSVTLLTSGTPTPAPPWQKGKNVSYKIAFANEHGPGPAGPSTSTLTIGDFAGASLTDIPQDANADAIWIYRTIASNDGQGAVVRIPGRVKQGTLNFTDVVVDK